MRVVVHEDEGLRSTRLPQTRPRYTLTKLAMTTQVYSSRPHNGI